MAMEREMKVWKGGRGWFRRHPRLVVVLHALAGVVIGGGLGYLVIRGLQWREVWEAYQGYPFLVGLGALAVCLVGFYLRALRWRLLLIHQRVGVRRLFLVQNTGIGLNNLVPMRVVSEPTQYLLLTARDKVSGGVVLATLVMERVLDSMSTLVLLGLGLLLLPWMKGVVGLGPQLALMAPLVLVMAGGFYLLGRGQGPRWAQRVPLLRSFGEAVANMRRHWVRTALAFSLTLLFWVLFGVAAWVLAQGMGLLVSPFLMVFTIVAVTVISANLPGMPGAVGTWEFAVVYLLGLFGVGREKAVAFSILVHALFLLPSLSIALMVLPREGWGILRQVRPLEAATPR